MTTVNPSSMDAMLASLTPAPRKASAVESVQDRFLTLLVTQMRNQDPLNPLDNAQVTSQLAQISTVTGIDKLNAALQGMSASLRATQSLQAGGLIGRGVIGPGNNLLLEQGSATGGVTLTEPADRLTVTVTTPQGAIVRVLPLGAVAAGMLTFRWDGSTDSGGVAPDGDYRFRVEALRQGRPVPVETLGYGRVRSVSLGEEQLMLDTQGLGAVGLGQIKQILQ
jgi:flagellar basal-body rod modification protein FlgD